MRRLLAPLAWILIGASMVATWFLVATGSSDLDDGAEVMPVRTVQVESAVRDATASATLVVSYPTVAVPAQVTGRLTAIASLLPSALPNSGVVWGHVDGRPRILAGSATPFAFHRPLAKGAKGEDVVALQTFLADLGYYQGETDGRFGTGLQAALASFRSDLGADTGDKALLVGDLVFADPTAGYEPTDLVVGTDLSASTSIGLLRPTEPLLQLRFLPRDASLVVKGSSVDGEAFSGHVGGVDIEPLAIDGTTTIRTGAVVGELSRPVAVGEVLQVQVTIEAAPKLWLPVGSIALDVTGRPYAVTPGGERAQLELGGESGGFVEVLGGLPAGTEVLLPNPDLFPTS